MASSITQEGCRHRGSVKILLKHHHIDVLLFIKNKFIKNIPTVGHTKETILFYDKNSELDLYLE